MSNGSLEWREDGAERVLRAPVAVVEIQEVRSRGRRSPRLGLAEIQSEPNQAKSRGCTQGVGKNKIMDMGS